MSAKRSIVIEEYLLTLYQLQDSDERAKAVTLAHRLKTSAPTVHATLNRMQRDGLISLGKSKEILLTPEGKQRAEDIAYRHNLAEYFLCNTLGIPWFEVHKHAHQLEHAMTPLVVEKLAKFLNYPEYCPHGSPMPGNSLPKDAFTLDCAKVGMMIEVKRIHEELEESEELLKILHSKHITPGQRHHIIDRTDVIHSLTLQSESGTTNLPFDVADKIIVTEVEQLSA